MDTGVIFGIFWIWFSGFLAVLFIARWGNKKGARNEFGESFAFALLSWVFILLIILIEFFTSEWYYRFEEWWISTDREEEDDPGAS